MKKEKKNESRPVYEYRFKITLVSRVQSFLYQSLVC